MCVQVKNSRFINPVMQIINYSYLFYENILKQNGKSRLIR